MSPRPVISETDAGPNAIVQVTGEIDVASLQEFSAALESAFASPSPHVIVDFSGLGFIDSSGISALNRLQKRLKADGRRASIVCPAANTEVSRVLHIMGVPAALPLFETVTEAASS